jgi:hypothetical protein
MVVNLGYLNSIIYYDMFYFFNNSIFLVSILPLELLMNYFISLYLGLIGYSYWFNSLCSFLFCNLLMYN